MNDGFVWPRQHAIAILKLDTKAERQNYLAKHVPEEYQDWVKTYVRLWWRDRKKLSRTSK